MASAPMMTLADLAEYLGVATRTIYQWRVRGEGPPSYRLGPGGVVRYTKADVDAWLDEQRAHELSERARVRGD